MKVKSESEVAQSYLTLSNPMDCSLPGSSVHGSFQARVLEWGAIALLLNGLALQVITHVRIGVRREWLVQCVRKGFVEEVTFVLHL